MSRGFGQSGFGGGFSSYSTDSVTSFGVHGYDNSFSSNEGQSGGFGYGRGLYFSDESLSVSDEEAQSLLYMIEEEKMAHDIYTELYEQTGLEEFATIGESEQRHYDKLLFTAERLDVDTSSLSTEAGVFANEDIQNLYDTLMSEASASTEAAVNVAISIEQSDIADLELTADNTDVVLLGQVYSCLENASLNHLEAFENIA